MANKKKTSPGTIAENRRARHEYFFEEKFEAGLALQGWEIKSLREGKAQLTDSYVFFKNGEAFLLGAQITPLNTVSTHFVTDPGRTRKLLLNRREIDRIRGAVEAKGYTALCTSIYWKGHLAKAEIALARGKQTHDKRQSLKERDWQRQKSRVMRSSIKTG